MLDKDYLAYLQMMGEESKDPKYIWMCLSIIVEAIQDMSKNFPELESGKVNLMGKYRIHTPSGEGLHKGPPKSIIS